MISLLTRAARDEAGATLPAIEKLAPEIAAEINGIASGAALDPVDVLLRSGFEFFGLPAASGCSAVAVATAHGALVAQNWDAPPSFAAELVLFLHFGPMDSSRPSSLPMADCAGLGATGTGLPLSTMT